MFFLGTARLSLLVEVPLWFLSLLEIRNLLLSSSDKGHKTGMWVSNQNIQGTEHTVILLSVQMVSPNLDENTLANYLEL